MSVKQGVATCLVAIGLAGCGGRAELVPDGAGPSPRDAAPDDDAAERDAGARDGGPDATTCHAPPDAEPPEVPAGRCDVRVAPERAHLPVGPDGDDGFIVVGGRRTSRVGRTLRLPGLPMSLLAVPGTSLVVVSDGGVADEQLSVIDVDRLEVVASVRFASRESDPAFGAIFYGLAASSDARRLVVSGGGSGELIVYDMAVDGALTRDRARSAHFGDMEGLRPNEYLAGLAYLEASATVVVASMLSHELFVWDVEGAREVRRIAMPTDSYPYAVVASADGERVYVTGWGSSAVYVVDPSTGTVEDTIAVGKNPQGMALSPDGGHLAVASSDGDSVALVDTTLRTVVTTAPVSGDSTLRGTSPVEPAWRADGRRLFVASAGDNAIDVLDFDPVRGSASEAGRIPTMWYPTDVIALPDGRVVFLNGKHEGTGANLAPDEDDITDLIGGSITVLDAPGDDALDAWDVEVAANNARPAGFASVECPAGAAYDFPIPRPGDGPSTLIEHVIVVIRENKTYDAYLGDLRRDDGTPHGNGDPDLTLFPGDQIEQVIPNTRRLALDFANLDNFFSSGEQSIQGHIWTAFGRTTDFVERTYPTSWGRGYWGIPPQGVLAPIGFPEEGSIFRWLEQNGIEFQNYNEVIAAGEGPPDSRIPGSIANYLANVPDVEKARFLGGRWLDECRMPALSYVLLPNDHTFGGQAGKPTPRSMIADNDEGVGLLVDLVSHSTYWPRTAIFVIEDDPQQGGDHVDNHRSPALVISPWVRRGYVSSVHYSEPSVWRTVQLVLGIERAPNASVEAAAPMLDMFTGTPDFTPYDYIPRRWPVETNPEGTRFAILSAEMDFEEVDQAEGLSRLLWEMLRGAPPPWPESEDP
ncbi:MAG: bifunctional YncE family protein/alkaline phosphatase family protein [Deltaproteobacteria bacterium]|nr:bifunctional YncE family protein/alkaline phosphatase family protein [Deltaproteobacteria bacterium]